MYSEISDQDRVYTTLTMRLIFNGTSEHVKNLLEKTVVPTDTLHVNLAGTKEFISVADYLKR